MIPMIMDDASLQLSGNVTQFPLPEVVQFLGNMKKNGTLHISRNGEEDGISLYFQDGNLVHAASRDSAGIGIFYAVLKSETGYFKFSAGESAPDTTIDQPIAFLLLESQRRADELRYLQSQLPPEDTVLFIVSHLEEVPRLNTFEWRIISMVNGRRTLKRICEKAGDELEVKKNLVELLKKNVISTTSGEASWKELVPVLVSSRELTIDRPYPPLLRTNLILKAIDGKTPLKDLIITLNMKENDLVEDIKLLYDTHWIKFSPGQTNLFTRLKHEL